jgi:CRP-like cAMP-binding protein
MSRNANKDASIENLILAALSRAEYERLLPSLKPVALKAGQILYEAGGALRYAYFLDTAMVSLLSMSEGEASSEVNIVGNEGVLGIQVFLRAKTIPYQAMVRVPGSARRMKAEILREQFDQCGPLHDVLLRYVHVLIIQLSQSGVCSRFHTVEHRLCRWLLAAQDRGQSNDLEFTQEFLSQILGGHRGSVSEAASGLQKAGLIRYSRGHISLLDRKGLEAFSCECYRIIRRELDRFFGT